MKKYFLVNSLLLFILACNHKQENKQNNFNETNYLSYKELFFNKYSSYNIHNTKEKGSDFISNYTSLCKIENCINEKDYNVIQSFQLYKAKDSITVTTFSYELIHFNESSKMDTVIQEIKVKNCIDETTMKIHRVYRLDKNTIIGVSFYNFDLIAYEDFLKNEFDKSLSIEVINISH